MKDTDIIFILQERYNKGIVEEVNHFLINRHLNRMVQHLV
jgi:hypothetical protein